MTRYNGQNVLQLNIYILIDLWPDSKYFMTPVGSDLARDWIFHIRKQAASLQNIGGSAQVPVEKFYSTACHNILCFRVGYPLFVEHFYLFEV